MSITQGVLIPLKMLLSAASLLKFPEVIQDFFLGYLLGGGGRSYLLMVYKGMQCLLSVCRNENILFHQLISQNIELLSNILPPLFIIMNGILFENQVPLT